MKNLISFCACLIVSISLFAQVNTLSVSKRETVETPIKYDGISNFQIQQREIDCQQYVGLKVYVAKGTNLRAYRDSTYAYSWNAEGNKIVDIIDYVLPHSAYFTIKSVKCYEVKTYNQSLDLYLEGEGKDGKKLYYGVFYEYDDYKDKNGIYLVDYITNQQKTYNGKKYVVVNTRGKFTDLTTGKEVVYDKPLYGGEWTCEVGMMSYGPGFYYEYDVILSDENYDGPSIEKITYLYKDTLGHVIVRPRIVDELEMYPGGERKYYSYQENDIFLMPSDLYDKEVTYELNRRNVADAKKIKLKKELEAKYGVENYKLMSQGKVKIGFSKEMCALAWGIYANIIARTQDPTGTFEVWQHAIYKTKLYFKNGKLYKIVN